MLGSKMLKTKHLGITNVATNAALNAKIKNKITGVNTLVKKADYDSKVSDMEKYFST